MVSCVAKRSTENLVHRSLEYSKPLHYHFDHRHSEIEHGQIGLDCCVRVRLVSMVNACRRTSGDSWGPLNTMKLLEVKKAVHRLCLFEAV